MKNIIILDKRRAVSYSYKKEIDECVIISITDIDEKYPKFNRSSKIKDVLRLQFADIWEEGSNSIYMCEVDVEKIIRFIQQWKEKVDTLVVHCNAGISRSSAIACAISLHLSGSDMSIWESGSYNPNIHCYKLMLKGYGIELSKEEIDKRYEISDEAHKKKPLTKVINKMIIV